MLTMVREFLLILLVASLAAAAISVVFLGFARWADMVRVEREALAAASTDYSYQMVTHEIGIGDWKLRRGCVVDNKRVVDSKRIVANVNMPYHGQPAVIGRTSGQGAVIGHTPG